VLINTVMGILGGYSRRLPASSLMKQRNSDAASGDIAGLKGARFVATSEPERGQQLNESLVKDLASSDTISARFNYGELFEYQPSHKIIMATNHLPIVAGTDNGIWRRLRVVPFEATFTPCKSKADELAAAFREEESGILNWLIEGCLQWQLEGLEPRPLAERKRTGEYRAELNIIEKFLAEACVTPDRYEQRLGDHPTFAVKAMTVYDVYKNYCKLGNYPVISNRAFGEEIKQHPGIESIRGGSGMIYRGIMVKQAYVSRTILDTCIGRDLLKLGILDYDPIDQALDEIAISEADKLRS
jgi:putative DNA primase/helicase